MDKDLEKIKNIYWSDECITVLPLFYGAKKHKHYMLHIFINTKNAGCVQVGDQNIEGKMIIVGSEAEHSVRQEEKWEILMLINPTSRLARGIQNYLGEEKAVGIEEATLKIFQGDNQTFDHSFFIESVYDYFHIEQKEERAYDERICVLIKEIEQGNWSDDTVTKLAARLHLSSSRLTHLFKQQTNMKLKSYLVMERLRAAYILLCQGKNVTEAAMLTGFDSPAHMAAVNKRMTGIRVTDILKAMKNIKE